MRKQRSTLVVAKAGVEYKICKVWFGEDGSYYVTVPYHPARTASLTKFTVCYDVVGSLVPADEMLDLAVLDDDEGRLKLSHHPDGFCQFSGDGVCSGKDEDGRIRGIGVQSRAISTISPQFGPVFSVVLHGIEDFAERDKLGCDDDILFQYDMLSPCVTPAVPDGTEDGVPSPDLKKEGLVIEGYYFQPRMRRFVRVMSDGSRVVFVPHPCGLILCLSVLLAPKNSEHPGFLGFEAYREMVGFRSDSGFSINGPAENYRQDSSGRTLGDVINCFYPKPHGFPARRSVNYPPSKDATDADGG